MSEKFRIYLAGAMTGIPPEEAKGLRNRIKNAIRFSEYEYQRQPVFFDPTEYFNFEEVKYESEREVMEYDLMNLCRCDMMIADLSFPNSVGTIFEFGVAREHNIPILVLNESHQELHPWLETQALRVFKTKRELVDYVIEFFLLCV